MKVLVLMSLVLGMAAGNAQARLMRCQGAEQMVNLQPEVNYNCISNISVEHQNRSYCVSRFSKALSNLHVNQLWTTCTEFAQDGIGKWVARVNDAMPFGAE